MIVRREIPEGEPERFTGNSKWLFVLKLPKTLVNSASERLLCNSGKLIKMNLSLLSLSFECEFDELISVKKILAVINATYAVAKRKPEKNI